jgi:hypothetical protein
MKIKIDKTAIGQYMLIYFIIMSTGSTLYRTYAYTFNIVMLLLSCYFLIVKKIRIKHNVYFYLIFIITSALFVRTINDGGVGYKGILSWAAKILITYVAIRYNEKKFLTRFIKEVIVFGLISLIIWGLCLYNVNMMIGLTKVKYIMTTYSTYYGGILYIIRPAELTRNNGIFNEPGLYQIVLCTAIFCLLFFRRLLYMSQKEITRSLILLSGILLTTQSTTGYISYAVMLGAYILINNDRYLKNKIIILITLGIVFVFIDFIIRGENSLISSIVFAKLSATGITSTLIVSSSGSARVAKIVVSIQSILVHPFGIGFDKFDNLLIDKGYVNFWGMITATGAYLFQFMAVMGIIPLVVTVYWIFKQVYVNNRSNIVLAVYIFIFLNTTLAQTDIFFPALLLIPAINYIKTSYEINICEEGVK